MQKAIAEGAWDSRADLAEVYLTWGGYAYGAGAEGLPARAQFAERLRRLQAVLHNQDNREHDILDSNDYFQFQGGMLAAAETLGGTRWPATSATAASRTTRASAPSRKS